MNVSGMYFSSTSFQLLIGCRVPSSSNTSEIRQILRSALCALDNKALLSAECFPTAERSTAFMQKRVFIEMKAACSDKKHLNSPLKYPFTADRDATETRAQRNGERGPT